MKLQAIAHRHCDYCKTLKSVKELSIKHIDGDPTNNDISNLAFMCKDCLEEEER